MTGLRLDVSAFFFFLVTMIVMSVTGVSVGYLVGTLFKDANTAMSMMPAFVFPFMILSGFYKNRADYAPWIGWIEYLSPFKYGFQALSINEFEVTHFVPNPIDKYSFEFSKGQAFSYIVAYFAAITIVTYSLLIYKKKQLQ